LPLLYGLCDEWTARRQLIGALGGEPDYLDESLAPSTSSTSSDPAARDARAAQISALAAAFG
jgi:hypothetical protein